MDDNIKMNLEQIMCEKSVDLMHLAYDRSQEYENQLFEFNKSQRNVLTTRVTIGF
jgi:hypothetical protein